jgi:RND family efflux transporter MFP subunit
MKKAITSVILVVLGIALGFGYGRWYGPAGQHQPAVKKAEQKKGYHCPMHPDFRSDRPGDCGICGMRLAPDEAPAEEAAGQGHIAYYQDPKAPAYRSDKPGFNPETGNELIPVYEHHAPGTIAISAEKQQWIGLKTVPVERQFATISIRVPGRVAVDETRIVRVQTRFEGWIQSVKVDFTGKLVAKGEPMLTVYSPELAASQQEFLLARRARETLAHSSMEHVGSYNLSMLEAARNRLIYHWGMSASAIEELERSGQPQRIQTLYAPASGFVVARNAYANQRVTPETELYTLADLSRVWVIADVHEADAAMVRVGDPVVIEPSNGGRVSYIFPQVDPQTRTLKARIDVENPGFVLKPEMFVNVRLGAAHPARLAVPEDAVIDTGSRTIVYVDKGQGAFEPREIVTGTFFDGKVEVLAGLKEGERVVAAGTFLLDSESRIKAPAEHKHD